MIRSRIFLLCGALGAVAVLSGCEGKSPTAPEVAGSYVGQFASNAATSLTYSVEVSEVSDHTIRIQGADFDDLEVDLIRAGGLITDAGGDTVLTYSADQLDFTYADITFQGSRSGGTGGGTGDGGGDGGGGDGGGDGGDGGGTGGTGGGDDCSVSVPSDALVISSGSQQADDNLDVLLCPGAELNGNGDVMNVYALSDAIINVSGDNIALWAESGVIATVSGSNNTASHEGGATIVLTGTNAEKISCDQVNIDTSALAGACD